MIAILDVRPLRKAGVELHAREPASFVPRLVLKLRQRRRLLCRWHADHDGRLVCVWESERL